MTRDHEPTSRCARCKSPIEPSDLRCALCALPVPQPARSTVDEAVALVMRCQTCGAVVTYDPIFAVPHCAFCGDLGHMDVAPDPLEEADRYLPFLVDEERARDALYAWIRGLGPLRPGSLAREATLRMMTPVWWVGWTFEVEATVSWSADSNHGGRRSRWAPHAGQRSITMRDVLVSASRGLSERETQALWPDFDLESAQPTPEMPPGSEPEDDCKYKDRTAMDRAVVERFDVRRSAARELIVDAMVEKVRTMARGWVPGTLVRHLHVAVLPEKLYTRRLAFPTYVLAYRYRGRLYRALVHGQQETRVLGAAPYSPLRIAALVLALLALVGVAAWFLA